MKNYTMPHDIGRRRFMHKGLAGCAAMSGIGAMSSAFNLDLISSAAAAGRTTGEYRALVCVFLYGGNDSFNMVVPRDQTSYRQYAEVRSQAAVPANQLIPLNLAGTGGAPYGLHPSLSALKPLFDNQKVGLVSNVGTLVEPTSVADYNNNRHPRPRGLRSHSDQQIQWQTSMPQVISSDSGWLGRISDLLAASGESQQIPQNISIFGNNLMLSGRNTSHFTMTANGPVALLPADTTLNRLRRNAARNITEQSYSNFIARAYAGTTSEGDRLSQLLSQSWGSSVSNVNTVFPSSFLGTQLKTVARTIAARDSLGSQSQTFYVGLGGWDTHGNVHDNQYPLLKQLGDALAAFQRAMAELNMEDNVTTFTGSDFGRRLHSNPSGGTDHGWGGMQLVMGGAVRGNRIHGTIAPVANGAPRMLNMGMLPTMSLDEYYAELALWYGVSPRDLSTILPNIGNFYNTASGNSPVGFLRL